MKQSEGRIQSPCVGNCCLDEGDVCLGCFRSLEEIKAWGSADDKARLKITQSAELRGEKRILG